jgi:hypothetical protein
MTLSYKVAKRACNLLSSTVSSIFQQSPNDGWSPELQPKIASKENEWIRDVEHTSTHTVKQTYPQNRPATQDRHQSAPHFGLLMPPAETEPEGWDT